MKLTSNVLSVVMPSHQARQLTSVAKANGHATAEEFIGEMVAEIATDEDCLIWVPVALTKEDYDFAVGRWGEDFRVLLDQLLGDALDLERVARRRVPQDGNA